LDDHPVSDGDGAFVGVDARVDPAQVVGGKVVHAVNARFDEGRAATRRGIRIMPWGGKAQAGDGPSIVRPYGAILLAETYQDPYGGSEWQILVASDGVYRTNAGSKGVALLMPPGETATTATDLVQTYNGMVMLRGADNDPLYMPSLAEGWKVLPIAASGKEAIPPAKSGIYFQNRLCVIDGRLDPEHVDTVWVSDVGGVDSVLQGPTVYQSFRINQGASDRLTALAKFNETTLICAKSRSIYAVADIYGDNSSLAQNARLQEITRQYGCLSPKSWVQVGSDLWFMGYRRGVCSIRQTETNALQGVDVPVSRDIQPIIDRINWESSGGIVAAAHDNRVFFAVPLDSSAINNAILVFSTLTQAWAGYDAGAVVKVADFVKFSYGGAVRLGFATTDGFLTLYEDGYTDHTGDVDGNVTYTPIATTIRTRGYMGSVPGLKRFRRVVARVQTWNPSFTVALATDGAFERETKAAVTKDRTRYDRPHDAPDWDGANATGDWETPYRQDYSAVAAGLQVTDDAGDGTVKWDQLQQSEEEWRVAGRSGHYIQVEFGSSQGRLEISGITIDTTRGPSRLGPKV
jgi:hypothetical protein